MGQILDQLREQNTGMIETRASAGSASSDEVLTKLNTLDGNLNHRWVAALVDGEIEGREL